MLTQEWKDTGLGAGRNRLCPKGLGGVGRSLPALGALFTSIKGGMELTVLTVATSGCVMCTKAA